MPRRNLRRAIPNLSPVMFESLCQAWERGYSGGISQDHRSTPDATEGNDREYTGSVYDAEADARARGGMGRGLPGGRGFSAQGGSGAGYGGADRPSFGGDGGAWGSGPAPEQRMAVRTTNAIERRFREVRRRSQTHGCLPGRTKHPLRYSLTRSPYPFDVTGVFALVTEGTCFHGIRGVPEHVRDEPLRAASPTAIVQEYLRARPFDAWLRSRRRGTSCAPVTRMERPSPAIWSTAGRRRNPWPRGHWLPPSGCWSRQATFCVGWRPAKSLGWRPTARPGSVAAGSGTIPLRAVSRARVGFAEQPDRLRRLVRGTGRSVGLRVGDP